MPRLAWSSSDEHLKRKVWSGEVGSIPHHWNKGFGQNKTKTKLIFSLKFFVTNCDSQYTLFLNFSFPVFFLTQVALLLIWIYWRICSHFGFYVVVCTCVSFKKIFVSIIENIRDSISIGVWEAKKRLRPELRMSRTASSLLYQQININLNDNMNTNSNLNDHDDEYETIEENLNINFANMKKGMSFCCCCKYKYIRRYKC